MRTCADLGSVHPAVPAFRSHIISEPHATHNQPLTQVALAHPGRLPEKLGFSKRRLVQGRIAT